MFEEDDLEMELIAAQKAADAHNLVWKDKWPKHCVKCGGWGGFAFTQYHDKGPGEQMMDICEALDRAETCHRCGEDGLDSDGNGPCKSCGWNYDDGIQRVM